jgi:hypothetical protein
MAIYLKDLVKNPRLLSELRSKQECCCYCQTPLQETLTGKRKAPDGYACSDCYYDKLGEEIEQHPIASAGIRRG